MERWHLAINHKKVTVVAFLDLQIAFDSARHLQFLEKIDEIGVDDETYAWLRFYLIDSNQRVASIRCVLS